MSLCQPHSTDAEQRTTKTTLYCPTCDHESPIDGDWIDDRTTQRRRLLCPRCAGVVVDQPTFDG